MKKLFALGAAGLLALGLASCEQTQQPTEGGPTQPATTGKTINLIYSGPDYPAQIDPNNIDERTLNDELFEDFKAAMKAAGDPNTYVIEYVCHGADKVDSEVLNFKDPTAPDVYEFASDKLANLYNKGALARITGANKKFLDEKINDFGQICASFFDAYYAYPYSGDNTYYLQYNKSIITDPTNMLDLMDEVAEYKDAKGEGGYKVAYNLGQGFWAAAAMFSFGADYTINYTEDGNVDSIVADFDSAKGKKAATAIYKIVNHPAFLDSSGVPAEGEKVAAVVGGTWNITDFKKLWGENYGCAVMPTVTVDGETKNLGAFLGGKLLGVNPLRSVGDKDRLAAAHKLAKFMADKDAQYKRFVKRSVGPCHKDVMAMEDVQANANMKVLFAQTEFAHAQTPVPQGVWDAPAVLFTAIKEKECTLENLQTYIEGYNKTVKGE